MMHALIRQGDGKYYVSAVFGYYNNIKSEDDYQRYIEGIHTPYYIVWDAEKKHLIKWFAMKPNTIYLIPMILIIDSDQSGWIMDEKGVGGVGFLQRELADSLTESGELPDDILNKCLEVDNGYEYAEYPEVKTEKDIEDLSWATGGFHDAHIAEQKVQDDGILYLKFDGTWGCSVEVWFWEDLEYDTSSRDPNTNDPYWFGSTIILQDGFVYFVDDDDMTVDKIEKGYCWFKARHMRYHIIPD